MALDIVDKNLIKSIFDLNNIELQDEFSYYVYLHELNERITLIVNGNYILKIGIDTKNMPSLKISKFKSNPVIVEGILNEFLQNKLDYSLEKLVAKGKIEGLCYIILEKLPGFDLFPIWNNLSDINKDKLLFSIGKTLKSLHNIDLGKDNEDYVQFVTKIKKEATFSLENKKFNLNKLSDIFKKRLYPHEFEKFDKVLNGFYKKINAISNKESKFMKPAILHGDLYFNSFITDKDIFKVTGLVNLESVSIGPCILDLAIVAFFLCETRRNGLKALLTGYGFEKDEFESDEVKVLLNFIYSLYEVLDRKELFVRADQSNIDSFYRKIFSYIFNEHNIELPDAYLISRGEFANGFTFLINDKYVIKFLPKDIDADFEISMTNLLKDNLQVKIPEIIHHGKYGNFSYIIMKKLAGKNLNNFIDSLNTEQASDIACQIGKILADVHNIKIPKNHPLYINKHFTNINNDYLYRRMCGRTRGYAYDILASYFKEVTTKINFFENDFKEGLCLGDFYPMNFLVIKRGDKYEISGMFDFSNAHIGPILLDLFCVCFAFSYGDINNLRELLKSYNSYLLKFNDELNLTMQEFIPVYYLLQANQLKIT